MARRHDFGAFEVAGRESHPTGPNGRTPLSFVLQLIRVYVAKF